MTTNWVALLPAETAERMSKIWIPVGLPGFSGAEKARWNALLTERFGSMADHLGRNGVDLATERIVLGPMLKFNPATEWAEGNGELDAPANQLATREYRAPYTVPEVL